MVMYGEKRRRKMIGRYPDLSLSDARAQAKRELIALAEPTFVSQENEFQQAVSMYLSDCEGRLHDLRRTFSTIHAKIGTPIHVTEKLLNHQSGTISGIAAIYNRHSYLDEMRSAVAAYEEFLENLLNS